MRLIKKMNKKTFLIVLLLTIIVGGIIAFLCFYEPKLEEPTIDFGYELEENEKVTIKEVQPDEIEDVKIYAYDFKLSSGQPESAIEISISYSDKGLKEDEEIHAIAGKYYNEETKQWEDVVYTVDTKNNIVKIITNHLSTYGVFKVTNPNKRNAYISEINVYAAYMSTEKAEKILNIYGKQEESWQESVASATLESFGDFTMFSVTSIPNFITLGDAYDSYVTKKFNGAISNLGVATACAQFAYDAYTNGLESKETAISIMKTALSIATNVATPSIQLAYIGVGVIDFALTDVSTFAVSNKYKSTKNMYDEYYKRKGKKRDTKDWVKIFDKIYKDNKSKPETVLELMKKEVDRYVNEYWEVSATDYESWIEAYDKNGSLAKYPWPEQKHRENISNIHKKNLLSSLQSIFRLMSRNMYLDSFIEREKEYKKVVDSYNQKYAVNIRENLKSDKSSTWAGYYARFSPLSNTVESRNWTVKLDESGAGKITFTLLGHLTAGIPMKIDLYKNGSDIENGKKTLTVTLKPFSDSQQTVNLEPRKVKEETEEPQEDEKSKDDDKTNNKPPVKPVEKDNPWYEIKVKATDGSKAFAGWSAVFGYPSDSFPDLKNTYKTFNSNGECVLYIQESDYESELSIGKIWLYKSSADLLAKKKADVIVNFSLGGSYSGKLHGEPLYKLVVKANTKVDNSNMLESISGNYSSYMIRAELFIPGEGMMQIDKKEDYEPWEKPSAEVWLHYNGPSLTLKSYSDPYLTEHVLEKFSDTRYEITYQNGTTTVTHTVEIISVGHRAKYTFLSETEGGQRNLSVYILEKK
ncbi:MAG: hypothetical protein PHU05_04560 [Bacilli bacterium]|nr:hypothetical protein [Bacilli bacterium]